MSLCMPVKISNKLQRLLECLSLLALATVLRCLFIGKTDLGRDEAFSLYMAQLNIPDIVKILCKGDNPPLWELLLHGWIKLFGISEVAIRGLSLIFSALTVIPIYFLGEKHLRRFAGIAASLCYCCSTFSIYMSHECRVYSLLGFLAACSVWLFISVIHQSRPYKYILLTLVNLMLMYGHYLSIWVIVMEFLVFLIFRPIRIKIWKPYLIHSVALILLFVPMFPVLFTRFKDSGLHGTWVEKTTGMDNLYVFFVRLCNTPVVTVLTIVLLLVAFVRLVISLIHKEYRFGAITVLNLLWVVPLLASFILSFFTGFLLDRYFYFLFPIFYLALVACCLSVFPKRKKGGIVLAAVFVLMMVVTCSPDSSTKRFSGWHSDVKPVVKQLVKAKEEENALVVLPENFDKQFVYYLDENHEIFRTHKTPVNYYVFQEYLHQQGYYYDYEYPQIDQSQYSKVVFPFEDYSAPPSNLP